MPRKDKVVIEDKTLSRRSLLEWVGRGTVFVLSSELLMACAADGDSFPRDGGFFRDIHDVVAGIDGSDDTRLGSDGGEPDGGGADARDPDGRSPDAGRDAASSDIGPDLADAGGGGEYTFAPGNQDDPVHNRWWERTVDPQDPDELMRTWKLRVDGMVENPYELSFAELIELPRQEQITDFHCVEGWSVYDVPWAGVHLSTLFERARPLEGATHVVFHTVGLIYNESLPIEVALEPKTMMGYGIAGVSLSLPRGFPLRVVVPRLFGYKNAKYVQRIELTDQRVDGYWVRYGYPYEAEVPESRLREGRY